MVAAFEQELRETSGDPTEVMAQTRQYLPAVQEISRGVFNRWASML
jgi:hypothetical protein